MSDAVRLREAFVAGWHVKQIREHPGSWSDESVHEAYDEARRRFPDQQGETPEPAKPYLNAEGTIVGATPPAPGSGNGNCIGVRNVGPLFLVAKIETAMRESGDI